MPQPGAAPPVARRAFLALLPDDAARAALAALPLPAAARRTDPRDLHLTLAFLGDLDASAAGRVLAALAGVQALPPPVVELTRTESWPGPRVLVAAGEAAPGLAGLVAATAERLRAAGFTGEARPFRPHVTLARGVRTLPGDPAPLHEPIRFPGRQVVLLASAEPATRPRYHALGAVTLGGG